MRTHIRMQWLVVAIAVAAVGCIPDTQVTPPTNIVNSCTDSDQCAKGEVCSSGVCIIGDCMVRDDCPRPLDQLCNELNKCIPDPASPIGNECPGGTNDCEMGEFCSAGTCYSVADAKVCRRQSDCSGGQRCDPINGFCVDDRGGCNRANEYPELACAEGDLCDAVTGHCNSPTGIPCTADTQVEDCGESLFCINNRCVQCTSNENCGVDNNICCDGTGTQCNLATGRCVSAFLCSVDEDCTGCRTRPGLGETRYCSDHSACDDDGDCSSMSGRRCASGTGECVQPECTSDSQCDGDYACDMTNYRCYRPTPHCDETNEPNNAPSAATPVSGTSFNDVLCRGDTDYLRVSGHANTRLRITIGASPSPYYSVDVALLDAGGNELDSASFSYSTEQAVLTTFVAAQADFIVKLMADATADDNQYNYTLTIEELAPLQCNSEAGEPNNTLVDASNSVLQIGPAVSRILCGEDDVDYHQFVAPAGLRSTVTVTYAAGEGEIDLDLLDSSGAELSASSAGTGTEMVRKTVTADSTLIVRVSRNYYSGDAEQESYSIGITTETPPPCVDPEEPNESIAGASGSILHTGPAISRILCGEDDQDFYMITAPANLRTLVTLSFLDSEGNIDLELRGADGTVLSYSRGYVDGEVASYGALTQTVLYARVYRSYLYSTDLEEQSYSIRFETEDLPDCDDGFEPNNSFDAAYAIGPGSYHPSICDEDDDDFYSISLAGGGDISVSVSFTHSEGDIEVYLYKPDRSTSVDTSTGSTNNEWVGGRSLAPGTYYLKIYPYSHHATGPQPYSLVIGATGYCVDDEYENGGNNTLATAYPLRDEALNSFSLQQDLRLCSTDDDWYRVLLLGDEMLSAEITGPTGIGVELYRQDAGGGVLEAAGREIAVASGRSTMYLGYPVPGRGAIYYLRVFGGGTSSRDYTFSVSAQTDTCSEDAAESNDVPELATPVTPPQLVQSSALCPLRDVDVYQVTALPGRTVHAAIAFNADDGDLDLVATLNGAEVDAARTVNNSGAATETIDYSATGCGELYISVVRHDGETAASIPYTATIDVTGGVVEDGGSCGGGTDGGAGG